MDKITSAEINANEKIVMIRSNKTEKFTNI